MTRWSQGRVALVGDAALASRPAVQAIAVRFAKTGGGGPALHDYRAALG